MQTGPESKLPAAGHVLALRLLSARRGRFYRKAAWIRSNHQLDE